MSNWQKEPKKTIYLLNIGNFAPKVTALTYPLIKTYAAKIRANIHMITERKFPKWPITYEKLQIYKLAQKHKNDWNIYIDSDCLIHPDTPDLTMLVPRDTVAHFGTDFAPVRWNLDRFFWRDGRYIGSGNWLALASDLCYDLWHPLEDLTPAQAIANISPTVLEKASGMFDKTHLIDDYTLSRNIARFGLKFVKIRDQLDKAGYEEGGGFFYHHYLINEEDKMGDMMQVLIDWRVRGLKDFADIYPSSPVDVAAGIAGYMKLPELDWLYHQAQEMDSVVELGSWQGRSTYVLCEGCRGKVYAVDHFLGSPEHQGMLKDGKLENGLTPEETFLRNVGKFPHLVVLKGSSEQSYKHVTTQDTPFQADMVFIDAGHTYNDVKADIEMWGPLAREIICGHDYSDPDYPGVKKAVDEAFGDAVQQGAGSIWWVQK